MFWKKSEEQPVEEDAKHAENATEDETEHNEGEQVAAPEYYQQREAVQNELAGEQNTNADAENSVAEQAAEGNADGAGGEEINEGDITDPRVFKMAVRDVDECYISVIRGLSAFNQEDENVFGNAVEISNDIITMEQNLFSEVPSYVTDYLATYRAKTDKYNNSVQPRQTIPTAEGTPRDWGERRAYVDPGVPLMLPYDSERFKREHPERANSEGTYHDLFYGDGSKTVFTPPDDNKRKMIEEKRKKVYLPPKQAPISFEPQKTKPMRVPADFVPACAEVKNPQAAKPTKPTKATQPNKGKKATIKA